jgi:hypothetical protein
VASPSSVSSVGGLRLVLGFEGFEQSVEVVFAFAFEDQRFGCQSVGDTVEADGGASFGSAWARAFLGVEAVGSRLLFCCHGCFSLNLTFVLQSSFAGEARGKSNECITAVRKAPE